MSNSATLTSTDRKHIIAMVSQKFLVRIKAVDGAIADVISALDNTATGLVVPLSKEYKSLFTKTSKDVNKAIQSAVKAILSQYHMKGIETKYGGEVFGYLNIAGLARSSFNFVVPRPGVDIEAIEEAANKVWDKVTPSRYDEVDTEKAVAKFLKLKVDNEIVKIIAPALHLHNPQNVKGQQEEDECRFSYFEQIRAGYTSKVSAEPNVKVKVVGLPTEVGDNYWPSLDIIESKMYDLNLEIANVPKQHPAYKAAVKAYHAAHTAIEKFIKERNELVQEHNDAVTRISMERDTDVILQILHSLGIVYNVSTSYKTLKNFTEAHFVELVSGTNNMLEEKGGIKMLTAGPSPDNDGIIDITAN